MAKKTPLYDTHEQLGAKLIDFGGFDMPVQYSGIKLEHEAVRNAVGMFDVSHMGEFMVTGPEALDLIQYVTTNDASKLTDGRAQYTVMCYEDGGIVDDLLVYRLAENNYMLVVNAANIDKDFAWIDSQNSFDAELSNASDKMGLLAVQGPHSVDTLQSLTDVALDEISFYHFEVGTFTGFDDVIISATGYTGEKGFEIYFDTNKADARTIWEAIMEAGKAHDIAPAGLGARDTLRLEMGYALYGNDISQDRNPVEAKLNWLVKHDKGNFIGKEPLQKAKENGTEQVLVGFVLSDNRSFPRHGYEICDTEGNQIGEVTSGGISITLDRGIGMGYINKEYAESNDTISIRIRKRLAEATLQRPPFIKK